MIALGISYSSILALVTVLCKQNSPNERTLSIFVQPSSCLSDKEEDEIYGFGYGVFGRQMLQQRQQKLALSTQNSTTTTGANQPTYQR